MFTDVNGASSWLFASQTSPIGAVFLPLITMETSKCSLTLYLHRFMLTLRRSGLGLGQCVPPAWTQ